MRTFLHKLILLLTLGIGCTLLCEGQSNKKELTDYEEEVAQAKTKKDKAKALINFASFLSNKDTAEMLIYLDEAFQLSQAIKEPLYVADCHTYYGFLNEKRNNVSAAEKHYDLAIEIYKKHKDWGSLADAYGQKGFIYVNSGAFEKALQNQLNSLQYKDSVNDPSDMAVTLNNIGNIYIYMDDYEKAKDYYRQSLAKRIEGKDSINMFHSYHNLGIAFKSLKQFDSALYYYDRAKIILEQQGRIGMSAQVTESIGVLYHDMGDYDRAQREFESAKAVYEKLNDKIGLAYIYAAIGTNYKFKKEYKKAIPVLEKAVRMAQEIKESRLLLDALSALSESYGSSSQYKRAYTLLLEQNQLKDSVYTADRSQQITEMETKYQTKKKELENQKLKVEKEKERAEKLVKEEELRASKRTQRLLLIVLFLVAAIVLVIFVMLRKLKKKNNIITDQKEKVEKINEEVILQRDIVKEKNDEIMDSINYARRLQEAILPPDRIVKEYLQNSFVLYKPKDIVAGDFYWMETANDIVYFAAADCTGHGVPGAMVSVVCSNALTKSLLEEKITDTGKILDRTRALIIERFGKSDEVIQDGMDVSLGALNLKDKTIQWSGAHNPLWVVRKNNLPRLDENNEDIKTLEGETDFNLYEVKADKQPVGHYHHLTPFTSHSIQLLDGDTVYLFSDGYPDQFGGEKGKKYKTLNMKRYFLSLQAQNMQEQRNSISSEFERWKGDLEQVDDVCVIGVRV